MYTPPSALTAMDQPFTPNNYVLGTNGEVYMTYSPSTTGAISQDVSAFGSPAAGHYPYNGAYAVPAYSSTANVYSTQTMTASPNAAGYSTYVSPISDGTSSTLNATTTAGSGSVAPLDLVPLPQQQVQNERAYYSTAMPGYADGDQQSHAVTSEVNVGYVPPPHPIPPQ